MASTMASLHRGKQKGAIFFYTIAIVQRLKFIIANVLISCMPSCCNFRAFYAIVDYFLLVQG
uniref:Uncharacterized protein n=1 Tax=Arundo donax TaxID=35708 RepID=A0A0A9B910_ARUDO